MREQTDSLHATHVGELIVVDDASTVPLFDQVWEQFVAAARDHTDALLVPPPLRLRVNVGAGAARNAGT
jgi:hypothetical protein